MITRRAKEGVWLYANSVPTGVFIDEVKFRPGTGDHEDPEEVREDEVGRFFRIDFGAAGTFEAKSGGGYFESLEAAVDHVEKLCPGITWK